MNGDALAPIGILLLVACLIAMVTRRFGWPYSVGLAAAGAGIAYLPNAPQLPLSRDLIFNIFLPPLVFEAALKLEWRPFRRELPVTLVLAFLGVAIAAAVVAGGMHWLVGWSWIGAALFAVLIAATDPVSVIASFRELGLEPRLSMLVESESLLNDGVAAVIFSVLSAFAGGASSAPASVCPSFLWTLVRGRADRAAVSGAAVLLIAGRTDDHLVEITLTTIAAYGSFLIAEHFHASGVLGVAHRRAGHRQPRLTRAISEHGRQRLLDTWDFFAFLANSFVFILIGMNVATSRGRPARLRDRRDCGRAGSARPGRRRLSALRALRRIAAGAVPARYQHILVLGRLARRARPRARARPPAESPSGTRSS